MFLDCFIYYFIHKYIQKIQHLLIYFSHSKGACSIKQLPKQVLKFERISSFLNLVYFVL